LEILRAAGSVKKKVYGRKEEKSITTAEMKCRNQAYSNF
jgi:hypothetical protein